jgi:hypothetical protein
MVKLLLSALCGAALLAPFSQTVAASDQAAGIDGAAPAIAGDKVPAAADAAMAEEDRQLAQLLGAPVMATTGEELGTVYDIIKGAEGPDRLIVETGGFMGLGEQLIAVPMTAATLDFGAGLVTLSGMSAEDFAALEAVEESDEPGSVRQARAAAEAAEPGNAADGDVPTEY